MQLCRLSNRQTVRYSLYPPAGDWRAALIIPRACAYDHPAPVPSVPTSAGGALSAEPSFLSLSARHLVTTGRKRAEDDNRLVLRYWESQSQSTDKSIRAERNTGKAEAAPFMDDSLRPKSVANGTVHTHLRAYEIKSLRLERSSSR